MTTSDRSTSVTIVAKLLWFLPLLLFVISGALLKAGYDQRTTLQSGVASTASVIDVEIRNRADVTYGHIDLLVVDHDGGTFEKRLPLPLSLLMPLEGKDEVAVRVLEGSAQEVVIEEVARAQWRLSLINSSMTFIGALLLLVGVGAWNRFLKREGDPGLRTTAA